MQLHDCEHYFCGWCAREWLRHHPTCPACRMTPTRAGSSRMIDNMLEAFLEEHADLAPSEQRRAEHASYTPGEDLLGPHATGQHYGHSYYSPQPIPVNNYAVHNHCKSELPTQDCTNFTYPVLLRPQSNSLLGFTYSACPKLWRYCQRRGPGCCGRYIASGLRGQPNARTILVSRLHRSRHPFRFLTRCSVGMIPRAASGATREGRAPGSCGPVCAWADHSVPTLPARHLRVFSPTAESCHGRIWPVSETPA